MRWGKANRPATEAERLLQCGVEAARNETPPAATPLAFLRTRVEARLAEQPAKGSIMARAMAHMAGHRKLLVSSAIVMGLLLVALLVPFSYTETVGYKVSFSGVDPAIVSNVSELADAAVALGYDGIAIKVNRSEADFELALSGLPTLGAAREVSVAFGSFIGTDAPGVIEPVEKPGSGTLYAQAMNQITCEDICVDINADMTDSEIEASVMAKLEAQGMNPQDIKVRTLEDGRKEIEITIGEGECLPPQ